MLPALQAGLGELNIFSSNGWQKREMVFSMFDPALGSTRGERGQV